MSQETMFAFIDRDGTLIFEPPDTYQVDSLAKLQILPGAVEGMRLLIDAGYTPVMVSNQDGLGTASFPTEDFEAPHNRMLEILRENGIEFAHVLICPHLSEEACACRKPKTGLLQDLMTTTRIAASSFVCGDRDTDRLLAENLGIQFAPAATNGDFLQAIAPYFKQTRAVEVLS